MKTRSFLTACLAVVFAIGATAALMSCKPAAGPGDAGAHKLKVITTLFPLYDMARYAGGDKAEVSLLLPPGVEPHSYEPKPTDIIKIGDADVFIYTGKFMEPWAADIVMRVTNKNLLVVDASQGTKMIAAVFHDADEPAGSLDPHIWLDFDNARIMVKGIVNALKAKDSANKDYYEQRASDYISRLAALDSSFKTTLAACKSNEIIYGGHYAFGYLARRYGLRYTAAQGISPDAEPTARDMANLVKQIRKERIKYVFYEELTSPKIAETLAGETGAKLLLLNAAHNLTKDELDKGVSYFDVLMRDLNNLKVGLECQ
ncbi:MAG: zinc ABC transporter substrate-binding protein [Nitrospirae bacterium]|nr:zinc ABC transporter substrate-binding protein [Nitrospirota bacterium]